MIVEAHRDCHHPHRFRHALGHDLAFHDLAVGEGLDEQRHLGACSDGPHIVVVIDRLACGGAHVGNHIPPAVGGGDVEEQVGEAEVGQHAPLTDKSLQVIDLVAIEVCVLPGELAKRGHE